MGQGQVRPVDAKISAVMEFPAPKNKRDLRRFLGMAGYYRGFCRNFSSVVSQLRLFEQLRTCCVMLLSFQHRILDALSS